MGDQKDLLTTNRKALTINLDEQKYGTFAEIGAGQEVADFGDDRCGDQDGSAGEVQTGTRCAPDQQSDSTRRPVPYP